MDEHTAGQTPELMVCARPYSTLCSIFMTGPETVLGPLLFLLLFLLPRNLSFKRKGVWQFLKPLLSFKFCGCSVTGKADLRRNVFLGTLVKNLISSAVFGLDLLAGPLSCGI